MTNDQYLAMIAVAENEVDIADIIAALIAEIKEQDDEYIAQLGKYLQTPGYLEIDNKTPMEPSPGETEDPNAINNKLKNNYRGYIVDQQVGYFMGKPISYNLDAEEYKDKKYQDLLKSLRITNHFEAIDKSIARKCSINGLGYRLLYFNKKSEIRIMNLEAYEARVIKDMSLDEVQYGIRYYKVYRVIKDNNGKLVESELTRVEWYDNLNVWYFIETGENSKLFALDEDAKEENEDRVEIGNPQPHLFETVPIVEFDNNEFALNDFKNTESLIDSYDLLLSNNQDEIDAFRLAYLVIMGAAIEANQIEEIKKSRVLQVKNAFGKEIKIEYLTKEVNDVFHRNQEETLNQNIMRFSQTVDFYDQAFSETSGEARKYKLVSMENKAGDKQTEMTKSLQTQFKITCEGWRLVNGIDINYEDFGYIFTRNLPVDMEYWAEIMTKLIAGGLPQEYVYGLMPFIDDVEAVMALIEKEEKKELEKIALTLSETAPTAPVIEEEEE